MVKWYKWYFSQVRGVTIFEIASPKMVKIPQKWYLFSRLDKTPGKWGCLTKPQVNGGVPLWQLHRF
jgi:hypothetical protein